MLLMLLVEKGPKYVTQDLETGCCAPVMIGARVLLGQYISSKTRKKTEFVSIAIGMWDWERSHVIAWAFITKAFPTALIRSCIDREATIDKKVVAIDKAHLVRR